MEGLGIVFMERRVRLYNLETLGFHEKTGGSMNKDP